MKLVNAEQMRAIDRLAIEELGIPGIVLMENAGAGTARIIEEYFEEDAECGVVVVCGPGNNGGDGFVIARHLINMGYDVEIFLLGSRASLKGDARTNRLIAEKMNIPITEMKKDKDLDELDQALMDSGLVVDAMFGTGLARAIDGLGLKIIELIDESEITVIAVDMPSGLSADTGLPLGPVIRADLTCTFGLGKVGQFLLPGAEICGKVEVIDISLPDEIIDKVHIPTQLIGPLDVLPFFAPRPLEAHKGDFGHALIIGGAEGMGGAAIMATAAAVVAGAGLVTACMPKPLLNVVESSLHEALKVALPADAAGFFSVDAIEQAVAVAKGKSVIAIGPGIGQSENARKFVQGVVEHLQNPLVIDADGLNAIVDILDVIERTQGAIVLTPHPGEMARLLSTTTEAVQKDRIGCALDLAQRLGVVVALKGARTIVANPIGQVWINPTGNPGMATGGMGDVLTGLIAGFIAQGVDPTYAAICGVYLHGLAGDVAKEKVGERALTAGHILDHIPAVFRMMEKWLDPDVCNVEDE